MTQNGAYIGPNLDMPGMNFEHYFSDTHRYTRQSIGKSKNMSTPLSVIQKDSYQVAFTYFVKN
jgi:hypothetical protein